MIRYVQSVGAIMMSMTLPQTPVGPYLVEEIET